MTEKDRIAEIADKYSEQGTAIITEVSERICKDTGIKPPSKDAIIKYALAILDDKVSPVLIARLAIIMAVTVSPSVLAFLLKRDPTLVQHLTFLLERCNNILRKNPNFSREYIPTDISLN
jgi:hypothetical protein